MKIVPYLFRHCYSAQITCRALVNVQVGFTLLGIAAMPKTDAFRRRWWSFLFPVLEIIINGPRMHCGQRTRFQVRILGQGFRYTTPGSTRKGDFWFNDAGFHLMRKRVRFSNV